MSRSGRVCATTRQTRAARTCPCPHSRALPRTGEHVTRMSNATRSALRAARSGRKHPVTVTVGALGRQQRRDGPRKQRSSCTNKTPKHTGSPKGSKVGLQCCAAFGLVSSLALALYHAPFLRVPTSALAVLPSCSPSPTLCLLSCLLPSPCRVSRSRSLTRYRERHVVRTGRDEVQPA
jgi:hypothetical protein